MKRTFAVAAREITERRLLFLGAFVAGLLPLVFPLIPALRGNAHDARSVAMLLLAITITVSFPVVFGATIVVGDIAQKRLSFYFSRPLPAASIWAGKLLAALLITIGCTFLAVAPVFFVEGESAFSYDTFGLGSRGSLVLAIPAVLVLLLLAHVVASIARLRSAWIALDFFLAASFSVAIALSLRSLFLSGFWGFYEQARWPELALWWLLVTLIAILLAASYVQVADGRTDARRSHGALSATLWGLSAIFAAILGGLAWWAASARATDLARIDSGVLTAPRGPWVAIGGRLRGGRGGGMFLFNSESSQSVRIRSGHAVFSANGSWAAWGRQSRILRKDSESGPHRRGSLVRESDRHGPFVRGGMVPGRSLAVRPEARGHGWNCPHGLRRREPREPEGARRVATRCRVTGLRLRRRGHDPDFPQDLQCEPKRHHAAGSRDRGGFPTLEEVPRDRPLQARGAPLFAHQRGRAVLRRDETPDGRPHGKTESHAPRRPDRRACSRLSPTISRRRSPPFVGWPGIASPV